MSRLWQPLWAIVAAVSVSSAVWMTSPAAALEQSPPTAVAKPASMKRNAVWHGSRRVVHRAVRHYDGRYAPMTGEGSCADVWCQRQFVLMLGIGF